MGELRQLDADIADGFKVAMSRLAAGVAMVTCHVGDKPWGLTVSACCSVSMEPPMLLVSLGQHTASTRAISESGRFGVGLLGERLIDVARFGAGRGQPKFMDGYCHTGDHSALSPVVAGALAHVDCAVSETIAAGDHVLFLGAVELVLAQEADRPLVYYSRTYHQLSESTDMHVAPEREQTVDSLLYDYPVPRRFARGLPL